jgi:virulence-associated protein VagC
MHEIKEQLCTAELESDTECVPGRLYRIEGRQVMVIPAECELNVSRVKILRVSEALIIYPRDKTWADYADLLPADSDTLSERQYVNNEEEK